MSRAVQLDPAHEPDLTRPRAWGATLLADRVLLRHYPVLTPGEDLTERTPEQWLTRDEWAQRHDEFGLNLDATPHKP